MYEREWRLQTRAKSRFVVGPGVLEHLRLGASDQCEYLPVVSESVVWESHGAAFADAVAPSTPKVWLLDGEEDKNLTTVGRILDGLLSAGIHRRQLLVVFGGGACCDVGGLVAMLY